MTPRETQFVKILVENEVISFREAGHLEHAQERHRSDTGEHRPVWDIAVDEGVLTGSQAQRFLQQVGDAVDAVVGARAAGAAPAGTKTPAEEKVRRLGGYRLVSRLGRGAMGAVYKAVQESMGRTVAIKVLPKDLARNEKYIQRFLREAKAAGRLNHPNVVAGIDVGFADGYYYFAMEYVEGQPLSARLDREGRLAEEEVLDLGRQVADALDHAHEMGIVHRDVKPENVLVTERGEAKLCDLGLARSTGDDMRLTLAGQSVGTPYYISPEQACGEEPDVRSDIYSLGCTLYHLVSNELPFDGDNPMEVMQKHINEPVPRLSDVCPDVSPALGAVVRRMMAKKPEGRYRSAREVGDELAKVSAGGVPDALSRTMADRRRAAGRRGRGTRGTRATTGTRPVSPADATARAAGEGTDATAPLEGARRRLPVKLIAIAGALLGLIVAVVIVVLAKSGGEKPPVVEVETDVQEGPSEEELRLTLLQKRFGQIQALEKKDPEDYAVLIDGWGKFMLEAKGTRFEPQARDALTAVSRRQEADRSEKRLAGLAADFKAIESFAAQNPEKYDDIIARLEKFAGGAAGTDFAKKARDGVAAACARRTSKARELMAALRRDAGVDRDAERFGEALKKIGAFPGVYRQEVAAELAALEKSVRASGKVRSDAVLSEAARMAEAGKFDAAEKKAAETRKLGLPELEKDVTDVLAKIAALRRDEADRVAAAHRRKYDEFSGAYDSLAKEGRFADLVTRGEALKGRLSPELEKRLGAQLTLAAEARDFVAGVRKRLASLKSGAFYTRLPLGQRGRFLRYDAAADTVGFRFGMGRTSVKFSEFTGELLVTMARRSAGGKLTAKESRLAACYLLARGEQAEVADLLKRAEEGGVDISDIGGLSKVIAKEAREVEAEGLLKRFDAEYAAKHWSAAVRTGERLFREFGDTAAVAARKDLAGLIGNARHRGSPLREYTFTLREGAAAEEIGLAAYSGCRTAACYRGTSEAHRTTHKDGRSVVYVGESGNWIGLARFAVLRREGGPLPDDAEILSAKLCLYKLKGYVPYLVLHRVTSPWKESEVTWNAGSAGHNWTSPGADVAAERCAVNDLPTAYENAGNRMSEAAQKLWYGPYGCEFEVTKSLAAMLKEGKNHGWRLTAFKDSTCTIVPGIKGPRVEFAGRSRDETELRPQLILKVRCRRLR